MLLVFGFALGALWIIFRRPRHEKRRDRSAHREADARREIEAELLDQLGRLEERVKVLERIVTDDPNELRRQFRDLGG